MAIVAFSVLRVTPNFGWCLQMALEPCAALAGDLEIHPLLVSKNVIREGKRRDIPKNRRPEKG